MEQRSEDNYDSLENYPRWAVDLMESRKELLTKLFVGGLPRAATDDELREVFSQYGTLTDCVAIKDQATGQNKGFGFVQYESLESVRQALKDFAANGMTLHGRQVDVKRAIPRENSDPVNQTRTNKIFIGGINPEVTEENLRNYFSSFPDVQIKTLDHKTEERDGARVSRKFSFIEFETEDAADVLCIIGKHPLPENGGKMLDVNKAAPKDGMGMGPRGGMGNRGGYAPRGGYRGGSGGYGGGYDGGYGGGYGGGGYGGPPARGGYSRGGGGYGSSGGGYGGGSRGGSYGGGYGDYGGQAPYDDGYGYSQGYSGGPYRGDMPSRGGGPGMQRNRPY